MRNPGKAYIDSTNLLYFLSQSSMIMEQDAHRDISELTSASTVFCCLGALTLC